MVVKCRDVSAALCVSCQLACEPYFQLQKRNRMVELSFTGYSRTAAIWEFKSLESFTHRCLVWLVTGWQSSLQSALIQIPTIQHKMLKFRKLQQLVLVLFASIMCSSNQHTLEKYIFFELQKTADEECRLPVAWLWQGGCSSQQSTHLHPGLL